MATWQTPLCPFMIDFSPDKLDEIRLAVVEGYFAVPHGGVEIGGVLFGKNTEGNLAIIDFRKIETEYLTGPSFRLSEKDVAGFQTLLSETRFKDDAIRAVGWFHSHTRSSIQLSDEDLKFHQQFFAEPWQIAMVLKPDKFGKVRAGFYFATADQAIRANAASDEFAVEPYFGEKSESPEVFEPETILEPQPQSAQAEPLTDPEHQAVLTPPPPPPAVATAPTAVVPAPPPAAVLPQPDLFQSVTYKPRFSTQKKILLVVFLLALIAILFAGYFLTTS